MVVHICTFGSVFSVDNYFLAWRFSLTAVTIIRVVRTMVASRNVALRMKFPAKTVLVVPSILGQL